MSPNIKPILTENDPVSNAIQDIRGYLLHAILYSIAINILMLTPIIYMLQVYDRVISSGSMSTLLMLTLLMMGLLAASGAFDWIRSRLLIAANVQLEEALRDKVATSAFRYTLITGNPSEANQGMSDLVGLRQFIAGNGIFGFLDATGSDLHRRHVFVSPFLDMRLSRLQS